MSEILPKELNVSHLDRELDLLKQELDLNYEQQNIIQKRINLLKETILEIPNTEPEYALLVSQKDMDLIELDELKIREENIKHLIFNH